jgi:hypothetical protein
VGPDACVSIDCGSTYFNSVAARKLAGKILPQDGVGDVSSTDHLANGLGCRRHG